MTGNPFRFGKEVGGYQFYDRREEARWLRQKLVDGSSNVVLFAPRRYGKTSLVQKVMGELAVTKGINGLSFDLTKTPTVRLFCQGYANAVYRALKGRGDLTQTFLRQLALWNPTLSVDLAGVLTFKLNMNVDMGILTESITSVLDLPERIAHELGDIPFVVAFDEFQEVADISKEFPLEKIFRSCIQAHRNVRYVFLGSKTHLMKRMFGDATRPFYNSACVLPLDKPPAEESSEFVVSRFRDAGMELDGVCAERLLKMSRNIPYYLQELASGVFEVLARSNRTSVAETDVEQSAADIVRRNAELYELRMSSFSSAQDLVVRALAAEPKGVFDEVYRARHALPVSSTVRAAVKELVEQGVVIDDRAQGAYELADPFFGRYVLESPATVFSGSEAIER